MAEKRNFALRDAEGNETGIFAGTAPRQEALKAATEGGESQLDVGGK
jgi:hypothetical protein